MGAQGVAGVVEEADRRIGGWVTGECGPKGGGGWVLERGNNSKRKVAEMGSLCRPVCQFATTHKYLCPAPGR